MSHKGLPQSNRYKHPRKTFAREEPDKPRCSSYFGAVPHSADSRPPRDWRTPLLAWLGRVSLALVLAPVAALVGFILWRGLPTVDLSLFFGDVRPWDAILGRRMVWEGIWPACVGTLCLVSLTIVLALLPGIGCGIYLAEYASPRKRHWLGCAVDMLAGVPSIVMGLFGFSLILFLRKTIVPGANTCLLLSAGCLALLVLPTLVVTTREAMLSVPAPLRLTAAALGYTPAQRVRHLLLPAAAPGILGGVILAVGRAAEDTAVIMLTGVVANAGLPGGLTTKYDALPFSIFYTAANYRDQEELARAFGAALILLLLSAFLLLAAKGVETAFRRRWRGEAS